LPLENSHFAGTSLSWLREQARARVQDNWQTSWEDQLRVSRGALIMSAPTCKVPKEMEAIMKAPCDISTRALQAMVGHGFFGKFYSWHVPTEWVDCLSQYFFHHSHHRDTG
jgi:hypothetical protein